MCAYIYIYIYIYIHTHSGLARGASEEGVVAAREVDAEGLTVVYTITIPIL